MRKEIVFAIIFGIIFSGIVALGFLRANKAINDNSTISDNPLEVSKNDDVQNSSSDLVLIKPESGQVASENPIIISGLTKPNSYVAVTNGEDDIFEESENGSFEISFELAPAHNYVSVYSIDTSGNQLKTELELVFSSEFLKQIDDGNETDSVGERLEIAKNIFSFYKGTITDITDGSIQLEFKGQEIKYLSIDKENTTFAKLDTKTEEIKYSDLAIGDYILALGKLNDKEVLQTYRVLVTSIETPPNLGVVFGTVDSITKSSISVLSSDGQIYEFIDSKNSLYFDDEINSPKKARFSDLEEQSTIICIFEESADELLIRRLHIISYPPSDEE